MSSDPTIPKPWWTAKSLWLGVILTVIGVTTYFGDPLHTPTMTLASISEAVGGVAAIVLRVWFTSSAIAGTPAAAKVQQAVEEKTMMAAMPPEPVTPPA